MAEDPIKQKITDALTRAYFHDAGDSVDVSDSHDGNFHVVVVSRKFDGRRLGAKNDLLWSILTQELKPEDWGRVTLSIGVSPEDIKNSML